MMIFQNGRLGRVLVLDGAVQLSEAGESAYHEMLVHVPMLSHAKPRHVLIIGGGDGGTLREVLRHPTVEKVTLVDIDRKVIDYSKQFLPSLSNGAFNDPRLELIIQDGMKYIANTEQKFDIIMVDCTGCTDGIGAGKDLYTHQFYGLCKSALNKNGILVSQHECPILLNKGDLKKFYSHRATYFKDTCYYITVVNGIPGGFLALGWATDCEEYRSISTKLLDKRLKRLKGKMQYYNTAIHKASFALPQFMRQ